MVFAASVDASVPVGSSSCSADFPEAASSRLVRAVEAPDLVVGGRFFVPARDVRCVVEPSGFAGFAALLLFELRPAALTDFGFEVRGPTFERALTCGDPRRARADCSPDGAVRTSAILGTPFVCKVGAACKIEKLKGVL